MQHVHISTTQLKNNTGDIISDVYFSGQHVIINRYNKPVAMITPIRTDAQVSDKTTTQKLEKYYGILPHFPDPKDTRSFRKKSLQW